MPAHFHHGLLVRARKRPLEADESSHQRVVSGMRTGRFIQGEQGVEAMLRYGIDDIRKVEAARVA